MKLELDRQNFLKAWQIVEKVAGTKTPKDSINGILIKASDNDVTLEATDLKTSVRCRAVGANVIEPGSAVLPAVLFGGMLKKAPSEDLVLEVNSSRSFLNAGRNKSRFTVVPAEEFPQIPESSSAEFICEILGSDLAKIISEGASASSQPQDFPKYVGACMLRTGEGYLTAASTDGKRLAVSKTLCTQINSDAEILITSPAAKDLGKTLAANYSDNNVKILADDSTAWFQLEDIEFSIRRVESPFPNYVRILNKEVQTRLKVQTGDLIPVLERVDIIARTTTAHIMTVNLNPENNEVQITARAPEMGTVNEVLYADVEENPLQIGFNVGFFLDGLRAVGSGEALIEFSSSEGQSRMYRNGSDDFLYMLMPARLSVSDLMTGDEISDFSESETDPEPLPENENNQENNQES